MGSRVRIRLFHILHFVILFPLLKNCKSGVVVPFDWLTGEQKIFVNYYDYAALIPSQLQKTLNGLDVL